MNHVPFFYGIPNPTSAAGGGRYAGKALSGGAENQADGIIQATVGRVWGAGSPPQKSSDARFQ